MNKASIYLFVIVMALSACSSAVHKKVLVMGKGDLAVNGKDITMTKGSGHAEKEIVVYEEGAGELTVTTGEGKKTIALAQEDGFYILNLKADTIVGSRQLIGRDLTNTKVMTQEELRVKIDSLGNLTQGKNITSGTSFIVLPGTIQKLSSNVDARVFGPFKKIPAQIDAGEGNKEPEIYKFYTNTEIRDLIKNLRELTY